MHACMQQDEWVVCRVFQKSAGGKKYPSSSTHSRAVNPFSYNLDLPQNPLHSHLLQPENFQFPGRNYMTPAEIQEFNKVFGGGAAASTSAINFPVPPQVNYGAAPGGSGSSFTISGLNLNLGRAAAPGMSQQDVNTAMLNGGVAVEQAAGYGGEMNNRFVGMDPCGDMDSYWPSY